MITKKGRRNFLWQLDMGFSLHRSWAWTGSGVRWVQPCKILILTEPSLFPEWQHLTFFFYYYFNFLATWHVGSWFPDQGLNRYPTPTPTPTLEVQSLNCWTAREVYTWIIWIKVTSWTSLVVQIKSPPASAGDTGSIPGLGRSHMLSDN